MQKNRHTARNVKCRFCDDFFGSRKAVHAHEVQVHRELVNESEEYELANEETRLRFTNQRYEMPAPVVVYADFESAIDDKNRHKPIMLSCLAVSRIPAIDTHSVSSVHHGKTKRTFVLSWTISCNCGRV